MLVARISIPSCSAISSSQRIHCKSIYQKYKKRYKLKNSIVILGDLTNLDTKVFTPSIKMQLFLDHLNGRNRNKSSRLRKTDGDIKTAFKKAREIADSDTDDEDVVPLNRRKSQMKRLFDSENDDETAECVNSKKTQLMHLFDSEDDDTIVKNIRKQKISAPISVLKLKNRQDGGKEKKSQKGCLLDSEDDTTAVIKPNLIPKSNNDQQDSSVIVKVTKTKNKAQDDNNEGVLLVTTNSRQDPSIIAPSNEKAAEEVNTIIANNNKSDSEGTTNKNEDDIIKTVIQEVTQEISSNEKKETPASTSTSESGKIIHIFGASFLQQYKCDLCYQTFDDCFKLKRHTVVAHKNKANNAHPISSHACYICSKKFPERNLLWNHMRSHSTTEKFCCKLCKFEANSSRELTEHKLVCKCKKKTSSNAEVKMSGIENVEKVPSVIENYKTVKKSINKTGTRSNIKIKSNNSNKNKKVTKSDTMAKNANQKTDNIIDNITETMNKANNSEKQTDAINNRNDILFKYRCSICKKKFTDINEMRVHKSSHTSQHTSSEKKAAGPRTTLLVDTENALKTIDSKINNKIDNPSVTFLNLSNKKEDQITCDTREMKPKFECCGKLFTKQIQLFLHMKEQLPFEKTIQCTPVYACNLCADNFNDHLSWYHHNKIKHKNFHEQNSKYSCSTCYIKFNSLVKLKKHEPICNSDLRTEFEKFLQSETVEDSNDNQRNDRDGNVDNNIITETESHNPDNIEEQKTQQNKKDDNREKCAEYRCDICYDEFMQHSELLEHEAFHRELAVPQPTTRDMPDLLNIQQKVDSNNTVETPPSTNSNTNPKISDSTATVNSNKCVCFFCKTNPPSSSCHTLEVSNSELPQPALTLGKTTETNASPTVSNTVETPPLTNSNINPEISNSTATVNPKECFSFFSKCKTNLLPSLSCHILEVSKNQLPQPAITVGKTTETNASSTCACIFCNCKLVNNVKCSAVSPNNLNIEPVRDDSNKEKPVEKLFSEFEDLLNKDISINNLNDSEEECLVIDEQSSQNDVENKDLEKPNDADDPPSKPRIYVRNIQELMNPPILSHDTTEDQSKQKQTNISYKCEECNRSFGKIRSFRRHQRVAKYKFRCALCDFNTCSNNKRRLHLNTQHKDAFIRFCCQKEFTSHLELVTHRKEEHKCPNCGRFYNNIRKHQLQCGGNTSEIIHGRELTNADNQNNVNVTFGHNSVISANSQQQTAIVTIPNYEVNN